MSPIASTSGWPGSDRSAEDFDAAGPVDFEAGLLGEQRRQFGGDHPRGPDDGVGRDLFLGPVRRPERHRLLVEIGHRVVQAHGYAQALQGAHSLGGEGWGVLLEHPVPSLDEQDLGLAEVKRSEARR